MPSSAASAASPPVGWRYMVQAICNKSMTHETSEPVLRISGNLGDGSARRGTDLSSGVPQLARTPSAGQLQRTEPSRIALAMLNVVVPQQ